MNWKPEGHPTAAPYLRVVGAQQLISFIEDVFGGRWVSTQVAD